MTSQHLRDLEASRRVDFLARHLKLLFMAALCPVEQRAHNAVVQFDGLVNHGCMELVYAVLISSMLNHELPKDSNNGRMHYYPGDSRKVRSV